MVVPNSSVGDVRLTSSSRIAVAVYRRFETALTRMCARRLNTGVVLRSPHSSDGLHAHFREDGDSSDLALQIECLGLVRIAVQLRVTRLGERECRIRLAVEGGGVYRGVYRWPDEGEMVRRRMPELGERLATYLLDEVATRINGRY